MRRQILIPGVVVLLLGVLSLAVADNVRPWRRQQAGFYELEQRRLTAELAALRVRPDARAAELQATMIAADEQLAARSADIVELERKLVELRAKLTDAERRRDALRYRLEQARYTGSEAESLDRELLETRQEIEEIREFVAHPEQRLRDLRSGSQQARERWRLHTAPLTELEERRRSLAEGAWWRRLPILGLFHPSISVREVAVSAVVGEPRVDRCVTCHLGAPRDGFEGDEWPSVWRSHPQLDRFVGEASPHPYPRFGCTVCHGGEGRATGFERAGHPSASRRESSRPIYPRGLFEAGCVRCHGDRSELRAAPAAGAGRRLVQEMGCSGCHRVPRPAAIEAVKPAPDLLGIAGKTTPAWAFQWLAAPRDFRPSTWMPHFFDLETAAGREQQIAEIRAIVVYLWENSRAAPFEQPPDGDAEAGRLLFESVGCKACHLDDSGAIRDDSYPRYGRLHGPNLARTGDKVAAPWLYAWLRDPRAYRHDTPMPSLRLGEQEAADLTAYLMSLRDPGWQAPEPPPISAAVRDRLVESHLRRANTVEESEARLQGMSELERNIYLGERSLARYGCHGCHRIPGFETAAPVDGGDLTALGDLRALRFLEGGHAGIRDSRSPEAPPSPEYDWSRLESEAVVVHLLGWQDSPGSRRDAGAPGPREPPLAGRAVLDQFGCRACHRIDLHGAGSGSELGPDLTLEGAKVRPSWLFDYLRDPGEVSMRPWQAARMPTFHWTDAQLDAVVRYFADRAGVELFSSDPPPPRPRDLAVGGAVFRTLQCNRCHPGSEGGIPAPQFAPAYELARERLRPDWVVEWILDPRRWDPATHMPASFSSGPDGERDASFLAGSLATPLFRTDQERLLRVFETEAELQAYFSDPRRVASAMRDHLWSLGE